MITEWIEEKLEDSDTEDNDKELYSIPLEEISKENLAKILEEFYPSARAKNKEQ